MLFDEVAQVLDALDHAGVRYWVGGGWGVALLAEKQTRNHRDLDLAVDAHDLTRGVEALNHIGYVTETDQLPVRVELTAQGNSWVDLHPVVFDSAGHGHQAGLDGVGFDYPPGAFVVGMLNGRPTACLSIRQQRIFHSGYELQAKDRHDLAQLDSLQTGAAH